MVVGATQSTMLDAGFTQVGADFPVFLHPKSHHEYALARLERKTGKGYQGFSVDTAGVSLEDDLLRRDLTINAMAIQVVGLFDDTPVGAVIDPYGGQQDLADKLLRHISPAFAEDPLRVLRVARFYARFYAQGFHVHTDTARLMQAIADSGELHHLSRERIWTESVKALGETHAFAYFELLDDLGILVKILPDLALAWQNRTLRTRTFQALSRACTTKNSESHQEKFAIAIKFALLISAFLPTHAPSGTANVAANTTLARTFDALMPPNAVKTLASLFLAHYHTVSGIITGLSLCDTGKSDDTASGRFIDGKTLLSPCLNTPKHTNDCAIILL
ncbi:Multifunctional CCA protein [Moraxella caviae]|nr:Multifunctional CCA protein [Moraxella caviae]